MIKLMHTPLVNLCLKIATEAHAGQFRNDKITPYITHPIMVASQFPDNEFAQATALLHDVVEDTDLKQSNLEQYHIPEEVLNAVWLLTKVKGQSYLDYLIGIKKGSDLATNVKIKDIQHNMFTVSGNLRDKYELALYILGVL